ncbi:type II toxin-antitoxin system VapC family toxin [Dyadobacter sp. BHUBP1]|uniref:type II toxin-antitoxin system VapC family toxin n=1 Tax=Dyadobacter sp. BHUBP1 TaxID=3424178 RepID=UPI003D32A467
MELAYLWDTNIAIYYLQQEFAPAPAQVMNDIADTTRICISAITEIELYSWKSGAQVDFDIVRLFVDLSRSFGLEEEIRFKAADLRRQRRIKLPDAVIAATAIVYNLTLITNNTKDFAGIENLRMLNPFSQK